MSNLAHRTPINRLWLERPFAHYGRFQSERDLRVPSMNFSERYKAQVEAERQYVLHTQQEARKSSSKPYSPDRSPDIPATVEEAFRNVCSENKKDTIPSSRPSDKPAA